MTQRKNIKQTQRARLNEILSSLRPDVTTGDRKAAMDAFQMPKETLSRYLTGNGRDNDKLALLIKFFQERISSRSNLAGDQ